MRHAATASLFQRRDVIIVASVSCIFGLGSPETYYRMLLMFEQGQEIGRREILKRLINMQYSRNDLTLRRGTFRARGDVIEIFPVYEERAVRVELFGDAIDRIDWIDPLTARSDGQVRELIVFPNSHYVTQDDQLKRAVEGIKSELDRAPARARGRPQAARGAALAPSAPCSTSR